MWQGLGRTATRSQVIICMMRELGGGKLAVALSDGMGSGEKACRESTLVMELLEELLEAGFPAKAAIQMINTTLVMGREEIQFFHGGSEHV